LEEARMKATRSPVDAVILASWFMVMASANNLKITAPVCEQSM
jgi:hypothetical protein